MRSQCNRLGPKFSKARFCPKGLLLGCSKGTSVKFSEVIKHPWLLDYCTWFLQKVFLFNGGWPVLWYLPLGALHGVFSCSCSFFKPIDPRSRLSHRHANEGMFSRHVPMEWRVSLMPKAENVRVTFGGVAGVTFGGWGGVCVCVCVCAIFAMVICWVERCRPWFNVDKEAIHVYEGANTNLSELQCLPNLWSFLWKKTKAANFWSWKLLPPKSWGSGFSYDPLWILQFGTPPPQMWILP